jgi:cellulose synthase/poly-beta-1,6-N-acetylglucosamine synthase-like glycosyltransferase
MSGSLWQTRWSVGFEIYHALKQLNFSDRSKASLNYPFNYCIGHGLFLTRRVFEAVGGFSENTHNEDAILGLQLSEMQELLMPIPYFDVSESPDTLEMLYAQKSNWYLGPLQSYEYMGKLLKKNTYNMFRIVRLFMLSTKLFLHAVYWVIGPTLLAVSIVLSIVHKSLILLLLSLLVLILFSIPSIISCELVLELGVASSEITIKKSLRKNIQGFLVFYILHGLSAYKGLCKYLKQILTGKSAIKEKTLINRV